MEVIDRNIDHFESQRENYPTLSRVATVLPKPAAPITGRDMSELRKGLRNPEKANVILLGEPGSGKTAYTQGFAYDPDSTQYLVLSIDVERLAKDTAGDKDAEIANGLLDMVAEVRDYSLSNDIILVLFIDEFHRIAMLSPSSVEALKPILEKSALNGFRIVAATTFEEYDEWISPNRALDQRLLRINLPELPRATVIEILKGRAKLYDVLKVADPTIFDDIYDTSRQILQSNSQPRASIDVLLNIIGEITKTEYMRNGKLVKEYSTPEELGIRSEYALSRPMLNRVIQRSYGIDIDNKVSVAEVRDALRSRILNQDQAVDTVISLLTSSMVGFGDPTRPKTSFLSTGTTGTGKALPNDVLIPVPGGYKRNGDLVVGDVVYDRYGRETNVTGVYPQGERTVYRVTLSDGRTIDCSGDHLWTYRNRSGNGSRNWKTATTKDLMDKSGLSNERSDGRVNNNYCIPMNGAVQREEVEYDVDPYAVGVLLDGGSIVDGRLRLTIRDEDVVERVSEEIGLDFVRDGRSCDFGDEYSDAIASCVGGARIPEIYKFGSIDQRWELIRGLFDAGGAISGGDRYLISYEDSSKDLIDDVQEVLWSLGVMSTINPVGANYRLNVKSVDEDKSRFFWSNRKRSKSGRAAGRNKMRVKTFDTVLIKNIERLDEKTSMTCIMVDNDEHLYQAGREHIVTHNTELAKVVCEVLGIPLKRFDMSRYPRPEDAVEFADELAKAAWSSPDAYILIDEVEKSSRQAMNTLLQVLDDARLTAAGNANRVVSFTGNIINLTTNLGSEVYQNMERFGDKDQIVDTELVYRALADSEVFETAVLGRVEKIVPFKPLPNDAMEKISWNYLNYNLDIVETDKRRIKVANDVVTYIVKDRTSKDSERGGARDAKRNVKGIVLQELANYIADATEEVPLIIHLKGTPRFKDPTIGDPLSAKVVVSECHSNDVVNGLLKQLSEKVHVPLHNDGLFVPKTQDLRTFVEEVVTLVKQGVTHFATDVDGEEVWVVSAE